MTLVWHMHILCWITKAINTHSEYVILIAFLWQQKLCECTSMSRDMYIACCILLLSNSGLYILFYVTLLMWGIFFTNILVTFVLQGHILCKSIVNEYSLFNRIHVSYTVTSLGYPEPLGK